MKVDEIVLTEKQKAALIDLNEKKTKLEKEYEIVSLEISKLLDFIFDSKNIDIANTSEIAFNGKAILYIKKEEIITPEVLPTQ